MESKLFALAVSCSFFSYKPPHDNQHVDDYNELSRACTWFFNVSFKTCTSSSKKLIINKTQS
jgi:hypothetical protein